MFIPLNPKPVSMIAPEDALRRITESTRWGTHLLLAPGWGGGGANGLDLLENRFGHRGEPDRLLAAHQILGEGGSV